MEWGLGKVMVSFPLSVASGGELWGVCIPGISHKECSNGGQGPEGLKDGIWTR